MIDVKQMKEDLLGSNPTLYCSAMAHLRGKLHMTKVNGGTSYHLYPCVWGWFSIYDEERIADERRHMFHWTMEDQAKLVEDTLIKYKKEEAVEAAVA